MAKMGGSRHLKRLAAPPFWSILRKEYKWVVKPSPGPHPIDRSVPLLLLIRDMIGIARSAREAKRIIYDGKVLVDNYVRKDYKFPIGLMDLVSIPEIDLHLRIVPYVGKHLWYINIPAEEAKLKLVRIENKTTVKNGNIQLNLHDGRNILIKIKDPRNPVEASSFKTLDSLLIELPSQNIVQHIPLSTGKMVIVIDGRNVGRIGKIINIESYEGRKKRYSLATIEDLGGHRFQTVLDYVMVIGEDRPIVKVFEG
ncbi:MAG: 30S ribosomal protein S4e [Ignisphaera sp.]|nr:30S ribosomal protein S4e [Ignisphaera sp.]MCX8168492.1 30S ribosomal protein S4e [Ignisphaera sp.]MDW8085068.1 30S ribosomal protein S4e [Ignisphaera sp.]